ncbi:putative glycine dehydrogenase (decarboxylating) subunit 1 [Bythopirellula goksoeyrii]|uniref:Probable glycine dehydrogenase (decarboxylating) subunit 1 n=2 Tax=Bythopirellula goksoeyrii TaxID=1400387 RepID=A0A5B9QJ96_9BACT|nr:putative glycine dehydrogenase (decarboxylating) subunit 1 [Bythopirellula goksoeyrii]
MLNGNSLVIGHCKLVLPPIMPYHYNTPEDKQAMLAAIGAESVDVLFDAIPSELKLDRPLDLPPALSEMELDQHMRELASHNTPAGEAVCFLGAGSYDHFIPAVVDTIGSRSEFYTSYTPYQAEASQGNLQVMFEYQSLISELTGLDVSNASLYDGASAAAEAVLMAISATGRHGKVIVPESLHPEYRATIATYLENLETDLVTIPTPGGVVDPETLAEAIDEATAAVVLQQPNFFGCVEDPDAVSKIAKGAGALLIAAFDPLSLGVLKRPGDYGANIAVAEGHTLGSPMAYGGPYLGIMACEKSLVRRMPGRIAGQTVDRRGNTCYVLTMQTREQHIRREKATSNVCTNQGLFALRATVYLAQLGPQGLRETASLCLQKSRYAAEQLCLLERFSLAFDEPTFKEFVIRDTENRVEELLNFGLDKGYLAGLPLGRWYPELADCFLVAVTEKRTKAEIDGLVTTLANASTLTSIPATA